MEYSLSPEFLIKLRNLPNLYENATGVNLAEAKQPSFISVYCGAKDVNTRTNQLRFLTGLCSYLEHRYNLKPSNAKVNSEEIKLQIFNTRLSGLRILLMACKFIQGQNSSGSNLNHILDGMLNINNKNQLDDETKNLCIASSSLFINQGQLLEEINAYLQTKAKSSIPEALFREFGEYIKSKSISVPQRYKERALITPVIVSTTTGIGFAIGILFSKAFNKSASVLKFNHAATTAAGGFFYLLLGKYGVWLLFPSGMAQITHACLDRSFAEICSKLIGFLGQCFAFGLERVVDGSEMVLSNTYNTAYYSVFNKPIPPNGISLINGKVIFQGNQLDCSPLQPQHSLEKITVDDLEFDVEPVGIKMNERIQTLIQKLESNDQQNLEKCTINEEEFEALPINAGNLPYIEELSKTIENRKTQTEASALTM